MRLYRDTVKRARSRALRHDTGRWAGREAGARVGRGSGAWGARH